MIPLCNLHTHTTYCDGKNTPVQMIEEAIRLGCHTIGFSGHAPADLWNSKAWCMDQSKLADYREELFALKQQYADQIEILVGLELDYYSSKPDWVEYTIGSVHQLKTGELEIPVDWDYEKHLYPLVRKVYGGDFMAFAKDFYTLSGAPEGTSENTYFIKAVYEDASGTQTLYADFEDSMTSAEEIPAGTVVTISIVIVPGVSLDNIKFTPTFVLGSEAGAF